VSGETSICFEPRIGFLIKGAANMAAKKNTRSNYDLPAGLAQPAIRALTGAGYTCLDQLSQVTEAELLKLHGMGPKAIGLIRDALKTRGQSFAKREQTRKP
jgi:hypothetical protein